ncbi:ROK family protein [Streptomyces sp. CMB-StM0423]|uniref:ROK family protein n=1 Tax=Streptomyces sp. CMB-StM0423 TaxID=2059884 RepID=UPI000C70E09E|nr:ROK family protein [Streptomyces sp. CMB-StM0423]AUH44183.1 ROK family protein [Streptomyces sp. CMB-StM0423]
MIPVLEIGGTHVTAALVSPRTAAVATRVRRPLDARARAEDILGAVLRCARALPATPAGARWGVAVPGPFDYATGIALFADVGKFESLYGVDVRKALLDGLPGSPSGIAFRNDAHAFLAGEWAAGAARGHTRAVGITLGTGVGSAFLADGTLHTTGPGLPPEGRMDLARIDGIPLEEVVSRRAILARYGTAADGGGGPGPGDGAGAGVDVREIAERARAGEERARRVLGAAFGALGAELGPRLAAFGATALVVGGSMADSWDLVAPPLTTALAAGGWRPDAGTPDSAEPPPGSRRLVRALLGEDAGLIGAAAAAGGAG